MCVWPAGKACAGTSWVVDQCGTSRSLRQDCPTWMFSALQPIFRWSPWLFPLKLGGMTCRHNAQRLHAVSHPVLLDS